MDIAVFLANSKCKSVSSIGKLQHFKKENAPEGATEYCLNGCKAKDKCPYDCEKLYIDTLKGKTPAAYKYLWPQSRLMSDSTVTKAKLYEAMKTTDFGKCVFLSDNNVVDYQTVNMVFENGIISTLTMTAFSGPCFRETRVRGTLGELQCNTESNKITLTIFGKKPKIIKRSKASGLGSHAGGDEKMIASLAVNPGKTSIRMSIESHMIGFLAEQSRLKNGEPMILDDYRK